MPICACCGSSAGGFEPLGELWPDDTGWIDG